MARVGSARVERGEMDANGCGVAKRKLTDEELRGLFISVEGNKKSKADKEEGIKALGGSTGRRHWAEAEEGMLMPCPAQDIDKAPCSTIVAYAGERVRLGNILVNPYGLGTLPMSVIYPDPAKHPTEAVALAIILEALSVGTQLFDTADSYCPRPPSDFHYAEKMLWRALGDKASRDWKEGVLIATKAGMTRISPESNGWRPTDCRSETLYESIKKSWESLGQRPIFLWQLHHPNEKQTPIESSLQAAVRAVKEGMVINVGLCNVNVDQIKRARKVVEIVSVQNEYSLWNRKPERDGTLQYCADEGIVFLPHGALGGLKSRRGERSMQEDFPAVVLMSKSKGISPQVCAPHLVPASFTTGCTCAAKIKHKSMNEKTVVLDACI